MQPPRLGGQCVPLCCARKESCPELWWRGTLKAEKCRPQGSSVHATLAQQLTSGSQKLITLLNMLSDSCAQSPLLGSH